MAKPMKAALVALALGASAVTAAAAQAQPRDGGHGGRQGGAHAGAPGGGAVRGDISGPRGGGFGGRGGFRGYGGWRGYGGPFGYGYFGWAPWGWYPYAPYYPGPYFDDYYDDGGYYDEGPPAPYYAEPQPRAQPQSRPAPRATAAPREFLVYFPFDSDALTEQAKRVVDDAAQYEASLPGARATIVGYTDAAGSEGYNQALSERRSQVVRETLLADGVRDATVDMAWKGKHDQAVRTPDGVKEPQNRRVTIVVQAPSDTTYGQRGAPDQGQDQDQDDQSN